MGLALSLSIGTGCGVSLDGPLPCDGMTCASNEVCLVQAPRDAGVADAGASRARCMQVPADCGPLATERPTTCARLLCGAAFGMQGVQFTAYFAGGPRAYYCSAP